MILEFLIWKELKILEHGVLSATPEMKRAITVGQKGGGADGAAAGDNNERGESYFV